MNLRQQILEGYITSTENALNLSSDEAFVRLAHSLVMGESIHSIDPNDITEGAQEKQIDCFSVDEQKDDATIYITQAKNTDSFKSNQLILLHNGLGWVFTKNAKELATLKNMKLRDKIQEYREMQQERGPSNLNIVVSFVTTGLTSTISTEFRQEERAICQEYDNNTFASFKVQIWGADELVQRIDDLEQKRRKVNATIRIKSV